MCSSSRGITLLRLPGKFYTWVLKRIIRQIVEPWIKEEKCGFSSQSWNTGLNTSSINPAGCSRVHGSLPNMCFVDLEKSFDRVPWGIL